MIEVDGNLAKVSEIGLFATDLVTPDGLYRFVPNSELWNKPVINFSRNMTRRIDLTIGIDYGDDIELAKSVLLELADAEPRVLKDPAPAVMVTALADSSVNLFFMAWAATGDFGALKSDLTQGAKRALEAAGISIPFPQRVLHHKAVPTDRETPAVQGSYASRDASEDR
jgi:small conductance mechanosensitive channel